MKCILLLVMFLFGLLIRLDFASACSVTCQVYFNHNAY